MGFPSENDTVALRSQIFIVYGGQNSLRTILSAFVSDTKRRDGL